MEELSLAGLMEVVPEVEVDFDPETYPTQTGPSPLVAGNYSLKVLKIVPRKDRQGNVVLQKDENGTPAFPIFTLQSLEVTDAGQGEDGAKLTGRNIFTFTDIRTKPFNRRDGASASELGDLLQAYDQRLGARNLREQIKLLEELISEGRSFRASVDWKAYDKSYANAAAEATEAGSFKALRAAKEYDAADAIEDKATLRGMKKFPSNGKGGYDHFWKGVNGDQDIEARLEVRRFYPSEERVKLGPRSA